MNINNMSLYPSAKLIGNVWNEKKLEQKAIRDGYGTGLVLAGKYNENVVALCADLTESTRSDAFAENFPQRFFECGVAEQNMACVAAGLALGGKIPFIVSYAAFSPGRNWEQIRTTIAYNNVNVKIMGHHAGVSVGPDGATHQMTEDIALMRVMPNMRVIVPCDALEAEKAVRVAAQIVGPVYIRFAREKSPVFTTQETPFIPGKAQIFWESAKPQVALIGCGTLIYSGLLAARLLEREHIGSIVLNCHTIKPLDEKKILEVIQKCGAAVTIEEHQVMGGLGGALAELFARHNPLPMEFVGMQDSFGESGMPDELVVKYDMDAQSIVMAAKKAATRK